MSGARSRPRVFRAGDAAFDAAPAPPAVADAPDPDAPPPPRLDPPRRARPLRALFWSALGALVAMVLVTEAWETVEALMARNVWLGRVALGLAVIVALGLLAFAAREVAALARFAKVDDIRARAATAWEALDADAARGVRDDLLALYVGRPELERGRKAILERAEDAPDADALLTLLEREAMAPLDAEALRAVRDGARGVAGATALLPAGLLDALAVLYLNVRMIRRVAAAYEGRAGWLGSWRLLRQVAVHLAATGAIAMGDDLIGAALGGGAVAKLSRKAGEGVVNGALTARIGVAAMEVCRPLPFRALDRPSVRTVARAALSRNHR